MMVLFLRSVCSTGVHKFGLLGLIFKVMKVGLDLPSLFTEESSMLNMMLHISFDMIYSYYLCRIVTSNLKKGKK